VSIRTLLNRVKKLEKSRRPQRISFSQALDDPALSEAFLGQFGIEPSVEVVPDKIERELERLIAEADPSRRLPNGLKLLTPEAQVNEETTDDRETDSCS
jgi:hypothetical protein